MLPQAKDAALAALALDDTIAESHTALGAVRFLYDWDWAGAEHELTRAIALSPGSADAHVWYAIYLAQAGRTAAAIDEARAAQRLDPLSSVVHVESGWVYYLARQPALALAEWRRVRDLEPQFAFSHTAIWAAYLPGLDFTQARIASSHESHETDAMDLAALIGACAISGKRDDASRLIGRLRERSAHEYFCPYEMATAEAVLGRADEAIAWLQKSVSERSACVPSMKADPRLDSLRADPRFADLLRAANVPR
jgi:tetratricopeptide (TPR) repeat protein